MRQIENMDYVPNVGDLLTLKYGTGDGTETVTGQVTKVYDDETKVYTGSVYRYNLKTDVDNSLWFMESKQKESVDLFRVFSSENKRHRMNLGPGDIIVDEIHSTDKINS